MHVKVLCVFQSLFITCLAAESHAQTTRWSDVDAPWVLHTIDSSSRGADGVKMADINGDGLFDIVTGWEEGGVVMVYVHPGSNHVRQEWPKVAVGDVASVEDAVFVDVDDDGNLDVISSAEGDVRSMFVHRSPGDGEKYLESDSWSQMVIQPTKGLMQWMFAVPFDVDNDGGVELIAAGKGKDAAIGWLQNHSRDNRGWTWNQLEPVSWVMSILPYDLDLDGHLDIMYTDRKGDQRGIYALLYDASAGQFNKAVQLGGSGYELMFMSIGDIDADEVDEIVVATRHQGILVMHRETVESWSSEPIPFPSLVGTGKGVAIGDLDKDGRNEIVVTSEHASGQRGVYYLKSTDRGWLAFDVGGLAGTKFDRIELVDMDNDGDLDVLTCEESENLGVIWYENPLVVR